MKYTKLIKSEQSVSIPMSTYIDLLQDRYNEVKSSMGETSLWPEFLDFIEETGPGSNTSPSYVVDNFLVNGEFVYKDTWQNEYSEAYKRYQGNWQQFCNDEAVIYNDEEAAINLGL